MAKHEDLPRLSRLEEAVLRLLIAKGELYGLQLVDESKGLLKRGTIYVTLDRMEDKGYVKSRKDAQAKHPGLPRPLYTVTGAGRHALEAWELAQNAWRPEGA